MSNIKSKKVTILGIFSKLHIGMFMSGSIFSFNAVNVAFGIILFVCTATAVLNRQLHCLLYFLQFMACSPMLYFFLPTYCIWHSDDLSWGKTRQVTEVAACDDTETELLSLSGNFKEREIDNDHTEAQGIYITIDTDQEANICDIVEKEITIATEPSPTKRIKKV